VKIKCPLIGPDPSTLLSPINMLISGFLYANLARNHYHCSPRQL